MDSNLEAVTKYLDRPGPTDLKSIFNSLGISYGETALEVDSFIEYLPESDSFVVGVHKGLTAQKKRFAYAHELSHYLLHRDVLMSSKSHRHQDCFWKNESVPSPLSELHDRQANRLALQILMPLSKLNRLVKEGIDKPTQLTKHFGISEKAVQLLLEYVA